MVTLKQKLFHLLSGKTIICCCFCLNNAPEKYFFVLDLVFLDDTKEEIKITDVIKYVLGAEFVQNIATEELCRDCLEMLLKCYKFIKACKENTKTIGNAIASLQKYCNEYDSKEIHDYFKTMYLTIDENDKFDLSHYYDQRIVSNCNEALQRLELIYKSVRQEDQIYDSCDIFDNPEICIKTKKKKGLKLKDDLIDKVPITDILYNIDNVSSYKCKVCLRIFPRLHNLKRHFIRVHAPKDYSCCTCNKSFGSPAILEEHIKESHSGKKSICVECGKKYGNTKSLKLHELSHKLLLKCATCGKCFNRQRNYQKHIESKRCQLVQRRFVERKYVCDYCNKKYACKGTLRVHIQFEHVNGSHHICSWCGKKFCSLSKLKAHSVTHTKEKNFRCVVCGGFYVSKESLLYHTRTHTGERPYQCEHCNQRFLSTSRRAEHIRRHHMAPSLECDVCHSKFRGRSCLLRHKKRHFDPNSRLHYTKLKTEG